MHGGTQPCSTLHAAEPALERRQKKGKPRMSRMCSEHISYERPIGGSLPDLTAPAGTGCRRVVLWELTLSSRPHLQRIVSFMLDYQCKSVVMK